MISIGDQLKQCIQFLELRRKGYKYNLTFGWDEKRNNFFACITGESKMDKSLPHDFASVTSDDFEKLPETLLRVCQSILNKEIESNLKQAQALIESNKQLEQAINQLKDFQSKLFN